MSARVRRASRPILWVALAAGLVLRLAVLWDTRSLPVRIQDERDYVGIAHSLVRGDGFAFGPGRPTSLRPPLYPALIAAIWTVTSDGNLVAVRVVQTLLALVTAALVYQLGRLAYDEDIGRVAAALVWLYPSLVFFNVLMLTETLFTCLLVAFVTLAVATVRHPRIWTAFCCGAALGLAALTRSVVWPLPLALCPLLGVAIQAPLRTRVVLPLLVAIGYLLVIVPWAVRNTRLQGVPEIVDTMSGMNLRMGNYEYTPDDRMWDAVSLTGDRNWIHGFDVPGVPTEGQKDKWAAHKAVEYMRAHPLTTARRSLIKFADFWGLEREFAAGVGQGLFAPPQWFAFVGSAVIVLAYAGITIAAAFGMWLTPPSWRMHALLLLPLLAIMGAHTIVFGHSRYHLPLIPLLCLYAAAFVARPQTGSRQPRWIAVGAALTVLILAAIWVRQLAFTDLGRIQALLRSL